ncbi:protein asymmetric leaves 2, partial [Tanacetum coccineum]
MDCLVKEQKKIHLGIKFGANIMVLCQLGICKTCCVYNDRITGQEGAEGNAVKENKVKESMKANLVKLLKYNVWSTRKHNSSKLEQELLRSKLMASSSNSPCAACKFLRRKCQPECVFAPYFPPDQPQKFANVHKVFGASNVTKLLNELHPHQREDAVNSLAYEADMRLRDPVYGCVGVISLLQHQLRQLQMDLTYAKSELSKFQNHNLSGTTAQGLIAAAAAAAAATHHQTLGNNLISCCSGGVTRDNLYHQHQQFFSPRDQQTSIIRAFDINNNYDTTAGVLAMNISSSARTPQQNGVTERRNMTLIKAARTMLADSKLPTTFWAEAVNIACYVENRVLDAKKPGEDMCGSYRVMWRGYEMSKEGYGARWRIAIEAVATACYTQNRSIIRLRHDKTPYELLHEKLLDLSFFHVFGALCYSTNDSENL